MNRLTLAAALSLTWSALAAAGEYLLTPTTVTLEDVVVYSGPEPLEWVVFNGEPDSTALLSPGDYEPFDGFANKTKAFRVSEIAGAGVDPSEVRLVRQSTDTISFANPALHSGLTIRNLTIEGSSRSAVMYLANPQVHLGVDQPFTDHRFVDVVIDGGWNWTENEGLETKWGILANRTAAWQFIGGEVRGIRWEHGFYFHQTEGGHLIEGTTFFGCGRTFVQVVNRPNENGGAWGSGPFLVQNVKAHGCGLADGGSGFTFSGHKGIVWLREVDVDQGPFGRPAAGAVVVWPEAGNSNRANGVFVLERCRFNVHTAKTPLVQISACDLVVTTLNRFSTTPHPIALAVNPIGPGYGGMGSEEFPALDFFPRPLSSWLEENQIVGGLGSILYGDELLPLPEPPDPEDPEGG